MSHDSEMPVRATPPTGNAGMAQAIAPGDVDTLIKLVQQQRHAEAEALARNLLARQPEHGFAWKALAAALKPQGRLAEALEAQRQAAKLLPQDAGVHFNLGNTLLALLRPDEAAASYRRSLALQPDLAEAHCRLGHALAAQSQWADAAASYQRALALQPDLAVAHARLGGALVALGQHEEAEAHLRRGLAAQPHDAAAHNALGMLCRSRGQLAEAEACYRRALAIAPDYAEAHNNLGNALRELGRIDEAEASYRLALATKHAPAEAHFNLGNILRDRLQLAEAEQSYRHALALEPQYLMALNNLGLCLKRQGRLEEAAACFEEAIAAQPDFIQAHCNLAPLKSYGSDDPQLHQLESQQSQLPTLPPAGQVSYWFALGKMREDAARYDDAFAAYAEGNRLQHVRFPPDEARDEALLTQLRERFDTDFFAARPTPDTLGQTAIFIVGMPRSGTTLIEQILSSHPGVHGAGELTVLDEVVHAAAAHRPGAPYPEAVAALSDEDFRRLGDEYLRRVRPLAPQAERITDKMPANFWHVGMIQRMLPGAKIVHAMRDPMDSCFSCYARLFEGNHLDFSYDLRSVGRYYVRYAELMQHWRQALPPGAMLDLRYEDMVADLEGQARRLLDYLGLPWDPGCLDFHRNRRAVRTASVAQVRRPIYRSSVARWKHFEAHLTPLLDIVHAYR